jgi:protein-S-isoprenylcysteine O-methyltransferase Ste14
MSPWAICGYIWIVFLLVWLVMAFGTKTTQQRESVSSRLSYTMLVVVAFYLVFGREVTQPWLHVRLFQPSPITNWLGVALTAAGIGFAIWARLYLGANWSGAVTVKVGHELVRSGPYRFVRHPIYTGLITALLGTGLLLAQRRSVIALVMIYAGFKIKSKIEERAMISTFGTAYEEYRRSVGAIIPKLYS